MEKPKTFFGFLFALLLEGFLESSARSYSLKFFGMPLTSVALMRDCLVDEICRFPGKNNSLGLLAMPYAGPTPTADHPRVLLDAKHRAAVMFVEEKITEEAQP